MNRKQLYLWSLLLGLLGFAYLPSAQAVPFLVFQPTLQSFNQGDTVTVDVAVTGLGSEIVAAYDLDVAYDNSLLNAVSLSFGTNLGDPLSFETLQSSNSLSPVVDLAEVSLLSDADLQALQSSLGGTVVLAQIQFNALGAGDTSSLQFASGSEVKGANNQVIVNVSVPEPATGLLLGAGLIPLVVGRKKATVR